MRLHRFFIPYIQHVPENIEDEVFVHQAQRVLRLEVGEHAVLFNGEGSEAEVEILSYTPRSVRVRVHAERTGLQECQPRATLYVAMLKNEHIELVVQKAVEVGIARIVPMITERTVKSGMRRDRLEKIAREAAEQSGRLRIPEIAEPCDFADAVSGASVHAERFFCTLDGEPFPALHGVSGDRAVFIGPEGGWTPTECEAARAAGMRMVSLGTYTLRAETAAIVAAYLVAR